MAGTVTNIPAVEAGEFKVGRRKYRYRIDGEPVRSVTEILDWTFGKGIFGAGAWWGQKVAIEGLLTLERDHDLLPEDVDHGIDLLRQHKLTTNDVRDAAADRGSAVHDAAEAYAREKVVPNPADFPPEQQGYVRALAHFLTDYYPDFLATEVVVGSAQHGYAGKYDMRVRIGDRVGLGDWKTGKRLYDKVFYQLAAYDLAAIECGATPSDFQFAVHLGAEGEYEYEESRVTHDDWLAQLAAYKSQVEAEERRKVARKK